MSWLTETPQCVVDAHTIMLSRLMAEEALEGATVAGVGRCMKRGPWARQQKANWESAKRAVLGARTTVKGGAGVPAGAGIKVVKRG